MHAARPQRVDGHRRAKRRIDAAREPEHHARKTVLLHVVAQARDAGEIVRGIALLDLGDQARQTAPAPVLTPPLGDAERLLPGRKLHGKARILVQHEGGAVEHELVLSAHLIDVSERQPRFLHARLGNAVTHVLLVDPIGRAVGHDEQFRPSDSQRLAHLLAPDILADRNAELDPAKVDRRRHRPRSEHPLLVEHAVIRQVVLEAERLDAAVDPAGLERCRRTVHRRRAGPSARPGRRPWCRAPATPAPPAPLSARPASAPGPRSGSR